ncbi:hypothetical protein A9Q87_05000 [Flavobacteriales bacterium 34_180_T64]|nr:hypothetical protein A9Q87_05000 [Flavobacteriales bacterium 34_180_T64]
MRKWIVIVIVLIIGILLYNYIYQDHRDIAKEDTEFVRSSISILNEFSIDIETSERKYLNKVIEVHGNISCLNTNSITLNESVFCQFTFTIDKQIIKDTQINIKGRFIGYDDIIDQIKLDQCTIIN